MIKFLDLQTIDLLHQEEIEQRLLNTFRFGWYLRGSEIENFKEDLGRYAGTNYAIDIVKGLDAVQLIFNGDQT